MRVARPFLTIAAFSIVLLQFVMLPAAESIAAGKMFLLVFAVLGTALWRTFRGNGLATSPVVMVFGLLGIIFFASALQAREPTWALLQVGMLAVFVVYLLLLTESAYRYPEFSESLIDALLCFGVIAALLGLYEYVHFSTFGVSRAPIIPYLLPPTVSVRITGAYGQSNQLALFLTVVLLGFFYRYLHGLPASRSRIFMRLRFLPVSLVALAFFLTLSRSGLLSFCLVFGFLAWLVASGRYLAGDSPGRREFLCLLFAVAAAYLVLKGLSWKSAPELGMVRPLGDTGTNPSGRFVFWTSAWLIFLDHPWLGIGLDHYKFFMNEYGPLSHKFLGFVPFEAMKSSFWAHNEPLQILSEGGVFALALVGFLLILFLVKIWRKIVVPRKISAPRFLYAHLMLLPFVIHSMFEWPMRSVPLLALFFALLGMLLSRYRMVEIQVPPRGRHLLRAALMSGLLLAVVLLAQEAALGAFKRKFIAQKASPATLQDFSALAEHPYSAHRVMRGALPVYLKAGMRNDDDALLRQVLPYYERLSALEGARWQWYDLARIYLELGEEEKARMAIERAIDLMPLDKRTEGFLHYLNMLKASRETGRPLDDFWPNGVKVDLRKLELEHD